MSVGLLLRKRLTPRTLRDNRPAVDEALCTGATFETLLNPDGDGRNYRKATWTTSGAFVLTAPGPVEVLVVGAGGSFVTSLYQGSGGHVEQGWRNLPAGTHAVTAGACTTGSSYNQGGYSSLGTIKAMGGATTATNTLIGAGDGPYGELTSRISGSAQKYAGGADASQNATTTYGSGGRSNGQNPQNGVVIARWEI